MARKLVENNFWNFKSPPTKKNYLRGVQHFFKNGKPENSNMNVSLSVINSKWEIILPEMARK